MDLSQYFDVFTLRTRALPALIVLIPGVVTALLLLPLEPLALLAEVLLSLGLLAAFASFARQAGKDLEAKLVVRWDGLPAQRALRLTESAAPEVTKARRVLVEQLLQRRLPAGQLERHRPDEARREYDRAVRDLIPHVRGEEAAPLLHAENVEYNFRRNLLGVRPAGVTVSVLSALASVAALIFMSRTPQAAAAIAFGVLSVCGWIVLVRERFVRQAAITYSDRLYEALAALARS